MIAVPIFYISHSDLAMGLMDFLSIFGCPTRKNPSLSPAGNEYAKRPVKDFRERQQPKSAPKRAVKKFEGSNLSATADEFRPDRPILDPNEPEWAQFLAKKAYETRPKESLVPRTTLSNKHPSTRDNAAKEQPKAAAPHVNFTLQTSEYLKLLKAGDEKAPSRSKAPPGLEPSSASAGDPKVDLAGALDSIIRSHWAGQGDKSKTKKTSSLKRVIMQERSEKGSELKGDALWRIAQMLDSKEEGDAQDTEAQPLLRACDDIGVERQNRDEDLAELAYWSDDNQAPRAIHRASAHKIGQRPLDNRKIREYVTHQVGQDLDRQVAILLLHLRRLNERNRLFEPQAAPCRRYCVGIKEVFRGVKNNKVKCVIVAPDIEEISTAGGLDDRIKDILKVAYEQDVPVIFSLSRVRIGRALGKSLRMSVLAVLDVKGCSDLYDSTIELAFQKRVAWLAAQPKMEQTIQKAPGTWAVPAQEARKLPSPAQGAPPGNWSKGNKGAGKGGAAKGKGKGRTY